MKTHARLSYQERGDARYLTAKVQRRPFSDPKFDQFYPGGNDISQVDLFSHTPQRPAIQAKLAIGQPNDRYEQEADSVAAQVLAMPDSAGAVQRQATPEAEQQTPTLAATVSPLGPQAQAEAETQATPGPDLENQLAGSKGSGAPLPENIRAFMEPRFGADFSQVRVHTGPTAIQMTQDLNAQAFTHGSDIYYGAGKAPDTDALTAHELTHVVQQGGSRVQRQRVDREQTGQPRHLQAQAEEGQEQEVSAAEEQEWLQAKPQIQTQVEPTIQRAWTGRRQLKPLKFLGKPWVVRKSGNIVNLRLFHEHIFFEDGLAPPNWGHMGKEGVAEDKAENLGSYSPVRTGLDDAKMRQAVAQVKVNPGEYSLLSNNCQDYVQKILRIYDGMADKAASE